jgi:FkbM family methyltransferase
MFLIRAHGFTASKPLLRINLVNIQRDFTRRYKLLKWRALARVPFLCNGRILTEVQGKKMYLDLSDRVHCETLFVRGIWEKSVTGFLNKLIRNGMIVIDIGANVGYYTLFTAEKVGSNGKVFAFEPEPSRYTLLKENIKLNDYQNVVPVQMAVSNKMETTQLYLDPMYNKGDHRLYDSFDGRNSVRVESTTLDDFFKDKDCPIHIIKMDIQGAEMAALQGMANTIKRNPDLTIITEFWPDGMKKFGFSPTEFLSTLIGHGFRLHILNDQTESIEEIEPEQVIKICKDEIYLVCKKASF